VNFSRFASRVGCITVAAIAVALSPGNGAHAGGDSFTIESLKPYVHDGTCCVLAANVDRWTSMNGSAAQELFGLLPSARGRTAEQRSDTLQTAKAELLQLGVRGGGMTMGIDDLPFGGPLLIVAAGPGADQQRLTAMAQRVAPAVAMHGDEPIFKAARWVDAHNVAIGGSEEIVERYSRVTPAARLDLMQPLAELLEGGALTAVVLSLDPDTRRVLRELWPDSLPAPLDNLTAATFADDVQWVGAELRDRPRPMMRITIALRDEPTAAALLTWIEGRVELLVNEAPQDLPRRDAAVKHVSAALRPRREGARLVLDSQPGTNQFGAYRAMIMSVVKPLQETPVTPATE
jgi:hypothetical protein